MDEDQGLDEGLKHTQSKESPRREETRNGKHQPLQPLHVCAINYEKSGPKQGNKVSLYLQNSR